MFASDKVNNHPEKSMQNNGMDQSLHNAFASDKVNNHLEKSMQNNGMDQSLRRRQRHTRGEEKSMAPVEWFVVTSLRQELECVGDVI